MYTAITAFESSLVSLNSRYDFTRTAFKQRYHPVNSRDSTCFGHSFLAAVNAIHRPCLVIRRLPSSACLNLRGGPLIRVLEQPLAFPVSAEV